MNRFLIALGIALLFSACRTTAVIQEDLSPAEIIQRANEAMDRNRYKIARQYYRALQERNSGNIDLVITAQYHIAFINYKRGNYNEAREGLNEVLAFYNSVDEVLLPQHFKRLAQIVLNSIEEKESKRRFSSKKSQA